MDDVRLQAPSDAAGGRRGRLIAILDGILAAALFATIVWVDFRVVFQPPESDNTVAYSLPAANLAARGRLYLPQLGSQYHLDRYWLLNSPLMACGQWPFFTLLGTTRHADLSGVVTLAALHALIVIAIVRRALGLRRLAPAVFLGIPFLLHFQILGELTCQRYFVIGFGLMALAFLPVASAETGRRPTWQWLLVGALPLVHPALGLAAVAWVAWEAGRWLAPRLFADRDTPPALPWRGLAALAVAAGLAVAWYGRPEMLREQFLPHLRYGNFRGGRHLTGLWSMSASALFAIPSRALNVGLITLAVAVTTAGFRPSGRRRMGLVLLPAVLISALLTIDALRGFNYFAYYLLGAGANLLFALRDRRARGAAIVVLGVLAIGCLGTALRAASAPIQPYDTPETVAFLVEHTRPGDRIVLGPPFVLAATADLPEGRAVLRVVPSPYFLADFDEARFRSDIAAATDVYLGEERWYNKQLGHHIPATVPHPIFGADASVTRLEFSGIPVVLARRAAAPHDAPAGNANARP